MLGFVLRAPVAEMRSAVGGGLARGVLGVLRTAVAVVNVPAGVLGMSLRHAELVCARGMGERPGGDVVAEARIRQGRVEAEGLGDEVREGIVKAWDLRGEKKSV